ncbi:transcriptional regulator GlxA family with amidase domain [Inquilinus ginsengisoli]|jgi:transcriptional regulator GlxA family with amidase domain|uniref:GlxA family transcriptional regulator n=1 Tax=Inquilinus TaxID=171673 RepID=UPI003D1D18F7
MGQDPAFDTETIGFLLIPQFSMIAFTSAVEPLRIANRMAGKPLYRWTVLSKDGQAVKASNGISVGVDTSLAELSRQSGLSKPLDMIFACSGLGIERYRDDEVFAWLRRAERQGVGIGALCTGSHLLARAGLLGGYRCAIHWENLPGFAETFPEIPVSSDLFEVDRKRYTCSGGTAAIDMMMHLIALRQGRDLATKVSEQCLVDRIRSPHDRQRLPLRARLGVHNPKLVSAIELMEANIAEPLPQEELAAHVGLSRRQLERLFRKQLGHSPAHYYLELRLERAQHLINQSDLPIVDLALACGFVSASHFSKCYRQLYGRSPREERANAILRGVPMPERPVRQKILA